ncbi:MAG: tetratricopeptide repeat protein [Acidobacteria bacterium]|nr:tetratricopeptide repeat protein [Acidobacteriota bacterium]
MKRESLVFAISGTCFGLIVGWILGSQQAIGVRSAQPGPPQQAASPTTNAATSAPPPLDETRVLALRAAAQQSPRDAQSRATLGNLYFDAERYDEAIKWYEESLGIDPKNPDVSTDLGVSYYYTNQPDRALKQFAHSLTIDPKHAKTMLNEGIVRAFGKQDLEGAAAAWQRVIQVGPDSPEARAAKQALDSMKSAHPNLSPSSTPGNPPGGSR